MSVLITCFSPKILSSSSWSWGILLFMDSIIVFILFEWEDSILWEVSRQSPPKAFSQEWRGHSSHSIHTIDLSLWSKEDNAVVLRVIPCNLHLLHSRKKGRRLDRHSFFIFFDLLSFCCLADIAEVVVVMTSLNQRRSIMLQFHFFRIHFCWQSSCFEYCFHSHQRAFLQCYSSDENNLSNINPSLSIIILSWLANIISLQVLIEQHDLGS